MKGARLIALASMDGTQSECSCKNAIPSEHDRLLEEFGTLRSKCPAIEKILVPDWDEFRNWDTQLEENPASHRSTLLLAFERGHLNKITSQIHRFLMESGEPKTQLTQQYRQDLKERWMLEQDVLERHHKYRIFMGKLVELQCAEWLYNQHWRIDNLEALGGDADIEATSPDGKESAFEVKYIGQEDWDFKDIVESIQGVGKGRAISIPVAANWILFKVYTAANQIQKLPKSLYALLVIDDLTWPRFRFVLENNYIFWKSPRFDNADPAWSRFLAEQKKHYPDIENDMARTLRILTGLWILKMEGGFHYSKQFSFSF